MKIKLLFQIIITIGVLHFSLLGNLFKISGDNASTLSFLKHNYLTRATAMGGAYSSITSDPQAAFYNPAATATTKYNTISLTHVNLPLDIYSETFSFVKKNSKFNYGLFALYKHSYFDAFQKNEEAAGELYYQNLLLKINVSKKLKGNIYGGLNINYINVHVFKYSAHFLLIDLGINYQLFNGMNFSAVLMNLGTGLNDITTDGLFKEVYILPKNERLNNNSGSSLPLCFKIGLADELWQKLTYSIEYDFYPFEPDNLKFGLSFNIIPPLSLMAGYNIHFFGEKIFSWGIMYDIFKKGSSKATIDYAMQVLPYAGVSHHFGLSFSF
jgi:hypothetical protein